MPLITRSIRLSTDTDAENGDSITQAVIDRHLDDIVTQINAKLPVGVNAQLLAGTSAGAYTLIDAPSAIIRAFDDRDDVVEYVTSDEAVSGRVTLFALDTGLAWVFDGVSVDIDDMPGCRPHMGTGLYIDHFGLNAIPGTTDMTTAVQAAADYAATTGTTLRALASTYKLTAAIAIAAGLHLEGTGWDLSVGGAPNAPTGGTWFFLAHTGHGFYCRDNDAVGTARRLTTFRNLGTYRTQPTITGGWAPTSSNADWLVEFRVLLENVIALNPYSAAKVRSGGVLWVDGLHGQPLYTGIECERSSDVQHWRNIHFWPYWSSDVNVTGYILANAVGARLRRADGLKINGMMAYGYARGIDAQDVTGDGSGLAGFAFRDIYADGVGGGIRIKSDFYAAYGTIESPLINSDAAVGGTGAAIEIDGAVPSQVTITGMAVTRAHEQALYVHGSAHLVHVQPYKIQYWDRLSGGDYAFEVDDGATINLLSIPTYSGGTDYYLQTSGTINVPSPGADTFATQMRYGKNARRLSLADDAFDTVVLPAADQTCLMTVIPASTPADGRPCGQYWVRATASPAISALVASHTNNVTLTTGALAGTTGTDGNLTISPHTDGKVYIENRTGGSLIFIIDLAGR